ncbi:hypothetical protein [Streptomyces sp. NPDC049881]|uniref:hypothetical protein n=1 Tax=Streptomyces sp. NPDC049881 TaxID=3155778 RepID=UPI0034258EA2
MSGERIYVRGEGGAVFPMDLPLPEPIADRLAAGQLTRVNRDGSPYTGGSPAAETGAPSGVVLGEDGRSDLTAGRVPRPPQNATKAEWIDHVVGRGLLARDVAENYTKADLIDLAGES